MHPIIITIASFFYLLLAVGAIIRFKRARNLSTYLQLLGVFLPLLPILAIVIFGFSLNLMILYAILWLMMGVGYIIEGLAKEREA